MSAKQQSKDRTSCWSGVLTAARTPSGYKTELAPTILAKGEPSTCREHDIYRQRVRDNLASTGAMENLQKRWIELAV